MDDGSGREPDATDDRNSAFAFCDRLSELVDAGL
jgi:hypothetical protein